jgi:hypothetical protein
VENPPLDLVENVVSGLRMTPAERSALHVLSRGQDPPMPPAAPGGERPEDGQGQRELIDRLDAPAAITDETWTLVNGNKALTAWTGGWVDQVAPGKQNLALFLFAPAAERLLPDIRAYRRAVVAGLRYQYVRHIGSERFRAVITALLETGPEARDLWGRHEIALPRRHSAIRIRHHQGHGRGRHADDLAVTPDMADGGVAARGPGAGRRVSAPGDGQRLAAVVWRRPAGNCPAAAMTSCPMAASAITCCGSSSRRGALSRLPALVGIARGRPGRACFRSRRWGVAGCCGDDAGRRARGQ